MLVDHIGYAVRDIKKARSSFEVLGYTFGDIIEDVSRMVYISFGRLGG